MCMKTAYFDCFSGISGDMCLGALVDAGVTLDDLRRELRKVPVEGYSLASKEVRRAGLKALKVDVKVASSQKRATAGRKYKDISGIIRRSSLSAYVKEKGLEAFENLFRAEGRVHGKPYTGIHLHELGAVDAVVDILGTLICLEKLGIKKVVASPVNLGWGTVSTEHGELPVPAPATVELIKGMPVYSSGHPYELTTPTGAVIIKNIASGFGSMPFMKLSGIGTGAGGRDIKGRPNVLRVFIGEQVSPEEEVAVIETNMDDMDPRLYEPVMERLLKEGALDVFITNIMMKKGRPAVKLSVICAEDKRQLLSEIILRETTTLGVRYYRAGRTVLERTTRKLDTKFGPVRVKEADIGGAVKSNPEYEDLKRAAKKHGVPVSQVLREVMKRI